MARDQNPKDEKRSIPFVDWIDDKGDRKPSQQTQADKSNKDYADGKSRDRPCDSKDRGDVDRG